MHFIYPKNYNFKSKLFGFIDYSTAIIDIVVAIILYFIVNVIFSSINFKIFFFVSLFFPIFFISIIGLNKYCFITFFRFITMYLMSQIVYLYKK